MARWAYRKKYHIMITYSRDNCDIAHNVLIVGQYKV